MTMITPNSLDYTNKDFSSLRRRLFQLIQSAFPTWTDTDVADFGNLLVELDARGAEVLIFYLDRQANESRITTALLRNSFIAWAKLLGVKIPGAGAAQTSETFTLVNPSGAPTPNGADVVIPAGITVRTIAQPTPVTFQLLADLTVPAGQTSASGTVENSTSYTDSFISSGLGSQAFRLTQTPYLDGSLVVAAGNGAFVQVDNFLSSSGTDQHFTVDVDEKNSAVVTFGDGKLGAIPTGTLFLEYRTWGGLIGTVGANTLTRLDGAFVDVNGASVRLVATNPAASSPGIDRPGVEQLRQSLPRQVRVLRAAVAREDFEIGAMGVAGVARALHLTNNEDPSVQENTGFLFIVPVGGGTAAPTLLTSVLARFLQVPGYPAPDLPALSTYKLNVVSAQYLSVDVYAKLYKRKGVTGATVKSNVLAALAAFFRITNTDGSQNERIDFGYNLQAAGMSTSASLAAADIFTAVDQAGGVLKVGAGAADFLLNGARADVTLTPKQFPILGNVTLLDADAGVLL